MMLSSLTWCREKLAMEIREFYRSPSTCFDSRPHDRREQAMLIQKVIGEHKALSADFGMDYLETVKKHVPQDEQDQIAEAALHGK